MNRVVKRYDSPEKHWKRQMVEKCLRRVKDKRASLMNQHRERMQIVNFAQDVTAPSKNSQDENPDRPGSWLRTARTNAISQIVREELDMYCAADSDNYPSFTGEFDLDEAEFQKAITDALEAEDILDMEYIIAEEMQELEFAKAERDEIELDMAGLALNELNENNLFVLCPICLKDSLREKEEGIACSCGVLLSGPSLNLATVNYMLQNVYSMHSLHLCVSRLNTTASNSGNGFCSILFRCEDCLFESSVPS